MSLLSCMIIAPDSIRERIAIDQADFDELVTRAIDDFAEYAQSPEADLEAQWFVLRVSHKHGPGDPCAGTCDVSHHITLSVREARVALEEIECWFAEHPPVEAPAKSWRFKPVAQFGSTRFFRLIEP